MKALKMRRDEFVQIDLNWIALILPGISSTRQNTTIFEFGGVTVYVTVTGKSTSVKIQNHLRTSCGYIENRGDFLRCLYAVDPSFAYKIE